jgi:hypothetical protein
MAKKAVVVNGAIATTGTFDITSSGFGTVDGAIIMMSMATATNTDTNHNSNSIVFYDGSATYSVCNNDEDAQARTDSASYVSDSEFISAGIATTADDYHGTISSITDGIRVTTTNTASAAFRYTAVLFGGGVSIKTGEITTSASINGTAAYTGASFTPQGGVFLNAASVGSAIIFGLFSYKNSTITQRHYAAALPDLLNDSHVDSWVRNDSIASAIGNAYYGITAVSSSGFTVTTRNVATATRLVFFLLGGVQDVHLGDTPIPASTGVKSWEGPGFQPQFLFNVQTGMESYNSGSGTEDC